MTEEEVAQLRLEHLAAERRADATLCTCDEGACPSCEAALTAYWRWRKAVAKLPLTAKGHLAP